MQTPVAHSQLREDFEEPIAVWNASPALRFGVVLLLLDFAWSSIAPSESGLLAVSVITTLFGGLSAIGIACVFTGVVEQVEWNTTEKTSRLDWLPRLRFETRVFGSQQLAFPPDRPIGFQPPREISSGSMAKRLLIAFIWMLPLLWILPQFWQGMTVLWGTPSIGELDWLLFVKISVAVTLLHEAIHALVAVHYGCGISTGVILPLAAYIRPSGAFLSRRKRILITLAPTVVITPIFVPVLFHANGWLVTVAFYGLLFNTVGAVDDLRSVWYLLKVPSSRLYYTSADRDDPMLVYDRFSQPNSVTLLERCEAVVLRLTDPLKIEQNPASRHSH
ncbi:DUF3267 domain-containing protein [Halococcus thailandensis]|jgi:hypothetical protein|uniref:Uncharacterized protein n=1 Tax=Halococcus thailandensis JCM 13552 TaxID=1227457 RepID=M0MW00_9EURY|nr:DUF3267 domain-containing protein [Halococcus thailandensis]EMA48979.1 hypothetical protein C451_19683 [Halococcus thailandensis JCM 13552]